MAFTTVDLGNATTASGASVTLTTLVAVPANALVLFAAKSSGTISTATVGGVGCNAISTTAGTQSWLYSSAGIIPAGTAITVNTAAGAVSALTAFYVLGADLVNYTATPTAGFGVVDTFGATTATSTTPGCSITNPNAANSLYVGFVGTNGPPTDAFTQSAGWTSPSQRVGAATATIASGVITASISSNYNPTLGTSRTWGDLVCSIRPASTFVPVACGNNNGKGVTTLVVSANATIPANSLIILGVAATGIGWSASNFGGGVWQSAASSGSGASVFGNIRYCINTTQINSGSSFNITNSTAINIVASMFYLPAGSFDATTPYDSTTDVITSGTSINPTAQLAVVPAVPNSLAVAFLATQGPTADTFSQPASWLSAPVRTGTTGGSAVSNSTLAGGWITTQTRAIYTPTIGTSRDWNVAIASFRPLTTPQANTAIGGTGSVSANATVPPKTLQASALIAGAGGALAGPVRGPVAASALIAGAGGAPVNYLPNPRAQGAVVGVVGSGGAYPYQWGDFANSGINAQIIGSGVQADGTPYCDVRYAGTPTGTFIVSVFNNGYWPNTNFAGDAPITLSAYMAMVGGSMANITNIALAIRCNLAPGGGQNLSLTPTATLTRYSFVFGGQGAPSNGVSGGWEIDFTAGLPIDITLRFGPHQLELGSVATAQILPNTFLSVTAPNIGITARGVFANASGGRDVSPNRLVASYAPGGPRNYTGNVGMLFVPTIALTFNRMGIRCPVGGTGVRTITLWNTTTNALVQSITIDLTGGTVGVFYYTTIPQVTLTVGNRYYLYTPVNTPDGQLWADQGPVAVRGASLVQAAFDSGSPTVPIIPPSVATLEFQYYGLDLDMVTTPAVANATIAGLGGWTNYVHNPRAEGAMVGTPGTLPTYWGNTLSDAGLSQQIVATGTDATSGLGYVDIRIFGTPSASSTFFIMLDAFDVSLAPGDRFTVTEWLAVVGGSVTNLANVIVVAYYNPVVDSIGAGDVRTLLTATLTPYGGTGIARNDVTSLGAPRLQVGYTASQPIDVTFRIAGPQLERGSVRTLPIYPPAGAPQIMTRPLLAAPGVAINTSARIDGSGGTTNWIRNPRAEGAVAGTPGTLPTFWTWAGQGTGPFTQQIVGTGIDAATGLSYVDVRLFGTAPGTGNIFLFTEPNYWQITAAGDTFTTTLWLALVAGSLTNINFSVVSNFANAGGNIAVAVSPSITATLTPYGATNAAPAGNIYTSGVFIAFGYFAGAVDITLRIAAPQLERGSVRTPIIYPPAGSPQVTTRGLIAGAGSFTPTGATINGTGGVRASIAPVAVPTGAVIAGGEANRVPLLQGVAPVSTDIVPPPGAGGIVFKHTRVGTTGDNNCGVAWTNGMPLVPYTFKVMVWIPAGWGGTLVNITTEGNVSAVVGAPANLSLTNQWQLVTGHAIRPIGEVALVARINDATATPIYTAGWQAIPDTVVAAPTILGNATLGGVGSVTATATVLATAVSRIYAGGPWNYIPNPRNLGAVPGTFPSGQLPTGWQLYALQSGQQVVGSGIDVTTGLPYVDVRFFGTTTGGFNVFVFNSGQYLAPLGSGPITGSVYIAMVGGDLTNISSIRLQIRSEGQFTPDNPFTPTATLTRYAFSYTSTISALVAFGIDMYFPTGAAIDITLRFGPQQLELGPVATPQIYPPAGVVGWSTRPLTVDARNYAPTGAQIDGRGGQTNVIRNPRAEGAIAGTPGTLPTYWGAGAVAGITRSIVGSAVENGISYVDIRWFGTQTQAGIASSAIGFEAGPFVAPGRAGQQYTHSFYQKLVGGSVSGINNFYFVIYEYDASGNFLTTTNYFHPPAPPTTSLDANRTSYTGTPTQATTAWIVPIWYPETSQNAVIDITVRLGGVQLEIGSVVTPLILPPVGVPGTTSRGLLAMPRVPGLAQAEIDGVGSVNATVSALRPAAATIAGAGSVAATLTELALPQQIIAGQGGKTNFIPNPRAEGAVPGSPGTLPTGWFNSRTSGLTRTIVGTGTENGLPYIDVRLSGTSTDVVVDLGFTAGQLTRANVNDLFATSAYLKVIAGDASQINFCLHAQAIQSNGLYLTEPYISVTPFPGTTPLDQARCATITTIDPLWPATYYVRPVLLWQFLSELAIDVTLRIGAPQLEARNTTSLMLPPVGAPQQTMRGVEAKPNQIVQASARIAGEGLIGADSTFVGQARANATLAGVGNIIIVGLHQFHAAHAVIHGTGSVIVGFAAKEAVKARLLGVGGVQATAAVAHPTIARIRGVGQIAAVSQRVRYGAATIAGNSRLYATAFPAKSGNVTIAGAGLLRVRDTIIAVLQTAAATITGTAAVHVQGRRAPPCDGLIEAEGNVYATAAVRAAGQALVAGAGTVDAHGTAWRHAEALLDGEGEVRGLLNHRPVASAGIGGVGQVAADGTPIRQTLGAAALIAGVGRVRADAFRAATVAAEALIAGLGAIVAIGLRAAVVNVDKTIAGVGNVRATVSRVIVAASATIAGAGNLKTNATQIGAHNAEAQIDGSSWLRVDSVTVTQVHAAATIQGVGGAVAHAARSQHARATIAGASSVTARGSVWAPALAMIAGAGALVAGHRKAPFPVYARVSGAGSVSAVAQVLVSTHVRIAGHADLADVVAPVHAEAQVRISVHGWVIERAKSQLEATAQIDGEGDLGFDGEQMSHRHTTAVIRGVGQVRGDPGVPREQIASQGVYLPPSLVGVSVL